MTRIAMALLVGALAFSPGVALASEGDHSLEQLAVEMANTADQHAALARYYRAKAEDSLAEARAHADMGSSYSRGKLTQRQRMKSHCQKLSEKQAEIAEEYQALAKLHEEASKAK